MSDANEQSNAGMELESRGDLEHLPSVQTLEEFAFRPCLLIRKCCTAFCILCICVLLSFFTSLVTTRYLLNTSFPRKDATHGDCVVCDTKDLDKNKSEGVQCCQLVKYGNTLPTQAKQVQNPSSEGRSGAQLSANQTLLRGEHPRLTWSHRGPDDYIDGVNHVTHHHRNFTFDCLEITRDGRYLITIQLTYRYTSDKPSSTIKSYFTLTRFRRNEPFIIAKYDHVVPAPRRRNSNIVRQPMTMVRSDPLRYGDRVCVTVSHPGLIYASKIDNFFGMVAL